MTVSTLGRFARFKARESSSMAISVSALGASYFR